MRVTARIVLTLALLCSAAWAKTLHATYLYHTDGDTVVFAYQGKRLICQLDGIDAPEIYSSAKMIRNAQKARLDYTELQELGMQSYVYLRDTFVKGERYTLKVRKGNAAKVNRCLVYRMGERLSVNEQSLFDGYALADRTSGLLDPMSKVRGHFLALEHVARDDRSGLWSENFEPLERLRRD